MYSFYCFTITLIIVNLDTKGLFDLCFDCSFWNAAWIQVSNGSAPVAAVFKTNGGVKKYAGSVIAEAGCWSMLKGGLTVEASSPAHLYFEVIIYIYIHIIILDCTIRARLLPLIPYLIASINLR